MLFLVFSHKIAPNCKVRDYKTAHFCIITYSVLICSIRSLLTLQPLDMLFADVDNANYQ